MGNNGKCPKKKKVATTKKCGIVDQMLGNCSRKKKKCSFIKQQLGECGAKKVSTKVKVTKTVKVTKSAKKTCDPIDEILGKCKKLVVVKKQLVKKVKMTKTKVVCTELKSLAGLCKKVTTKKYLLATTNVIGDVSCI